MVLSVLRCAHQTTAFQTSCTPMKTKLNSTKLLPWQILKNKHWSIKVTTQQTFLFYEWLEVVHDIPWSGNSTLDWLWATCKRCLKSEVKCSVRKMIEFWRAERNILVTKKGDRCFVFIAIILSFSLAKNHWKSQSINGFHRGILNNNKVYLCILSLNRMN